MKTIEQLQEENAALVATVEALRSEIEFSATAILERSPSEEIHAIACSMIETAKATPQHHLREVRAAAGRAGFVEGVRQEMLDKFGLFYLETQDRANQYAEQIRKGEVK